MLLVFLRLRVESLFKNLFKSHEVMLGKIFDRFMYMLISFSHCQNIPYKGKKIGGELLVQNLMDNHKTSPTSQKNQKNFGRINKFGHFSFCLLDTGTLSCSKCPLFLFLAEMIHLSMYFIK